MAISKTTYLELNKPDYDAVADIEVLNDNADIIDEQFDGTHLVTSVNGVTPTGGAVDIDLGVTSVNGQTGDVTVTERSIKQLIDIIYPVGTYYETTDSTFNPNTAWVGTEWQRITDGRVLIAGGDEYTVGTNYGEKTHKITTSEMPAHNHSASSASNGAHGHTASTGSAGNHSHTRGSMDIVGTFGSGQNTPSIYRGDTSGAFYNSGTNGNKYAGSSTENDRTSKVTFQASRNWTGSTSTAGAHTHTVSVNNNGAHSHTITVGNSGSGTAMSLVQPSKAVARWLRTA